MRAEDVGWSQNKLVLGKHSGRNAFKTRLAELGIDLPSEEALNAAFARFKELADKKHEISTRISIAPAAITASRCSGTGTPSPSRSAPTPIASTTPRL